MRHPVEYPAGAAPLASEEAHPNINSLMAGNAATTMIWRARQGRRCPKRVVRTLALPFARAALLLATWSLSHMSFAADTASHTPNAVRRGELITLVRQDCGSCHGLTLKGGLGPALLPETLLNKPADSLKATILYGRPGTAMPPWQRFVSEAEAQWIVENLQKGFPSER